MGSCHGEAQEALGVYGWWAGVDGNNGPPTAESNAMKNKNFPVVLRKANGKTSSYGEE